MEVHPALVEGGTAVVTLPHPAGVVVGGGGRLPHPDAVGNGGVCKVKLAHPPAFAKTPPGPAEALGPPAIPTDTPPPPTTAVAPPALTQPELAVG